MCGHTLAFLAGLLLPTMFSQLPPIGLVWWLATVSLGLLFSLPKAWLRWCSWLIVYTLGFTWCCYNAHHVLATTLPTVLLTKLLTTTGRIVSIPAVKLNATHFEYAIDGINGQTGLNYPIKVQLSYYVHGHEERPNFRVGERWQCTVRLKRPRGFWNPGSFDYQAWLFQRHIRATGYVVTRFKPRLLSQHYQPVEALRAQLADVVATTLQAYPLAGLMNALVDGIRYQITEQQWQVMRATGTNHLFAIAGLHVGFISGLFYCLVNFCWRRFGHLSLWLPAPQAAVIVALLAAMFYSGLAGFSLPTQRAVIMLSVFLTANLLRRNLAAWHGWCIAMWVVLLYEPLVVLMESFWLSFGAVAWLIYGTAGRIKPHGWWWHWGRAQWVIALGLIPISLRFFQQVSLISVFANVIAIPWVGFLVLPLGLLGALLSLVLPQIGGILLVLAEQLLELIWWLLTAMASVTWLQWYSAIDDTWGLLVATLAMGLLLLPRGAPGRLLGLIWFLPVVLVNSTAPSAGEIWLTLLDVGQGLAAVLRTQRHVLVYDTGPRFSAFLDSGDAVILPFLRRQGIQWIDSLIVSHPDNDHSGGVNAILQHMPVRELITSTPDKFIPKLAHLCTCGQQWYWDGVHFEVLYPRQGYYGYGNDSSCVLKVSNGYYHILFTGDIQKRGERYLVNTAYNKLAATILIAPHHGSKTSSSPQFITAVQPTYVLFAVGYQNRFGFPHPQIINRYQNRGIQYYSTADTGAITFRLGTKPDQLSTETYSDSQRRFWQ